MSRMRCLVDRFFWCVLDSEDNSDGVFCCQCSFDPQMERAEMRYKAKITREKNKMEVRK